MSITAAQAEDAEIETVVVTAEKRAEDILKVPGSIAALPQARLEDYGVNDVQDYSMYIPDLQITAPVSGTTKTTIRGLSSESNTSTVGVYINETPVTQNELDPDMKLFDVARIEVLRGPQGTLYGEGSLGGTLRIITNAPDTSGFKTAFEARSSQFANGDGLNFGINGMVNVPVTDTVAIRGVLGYVDNKPWITNLGPGDSQNFERGLTSRLAAKWSPTEAFSATATYIYQNESLGSPRALIDPTLRGFKRFTRVDESDGDRLNVGSLDWDYDFGFATLTSDTSYYHRTQHTIGNNNQTGGINFFYNEINGAAAGFPPFSQFANPPGFPFLTVPESAVDFLGTTRSWSEEARLVSSPGNSPIDWIVGVFYQSRRDIKDTDFFGLLTGAAPVFDLLGSNVYRSNTTISDRYDQIAGFGEVTWHILDNLELTGGLRYSSERVEHQENLDGAFEYNFGSSPPTTTPVQFGPSAKTFTSTTPRAVLTWHPSEDWIAYTTVAKGFRVGGFTGTVPYNPDTVWNYEIGAKGVFWDGKANLAAALYYIDWSDTQAQVDTAAPPFFAFLNIGDTVSKGIEAELTVRPVEGLEIFSGLNLIDAHVTKVDPAALSTSPGLIVGNKMQKIPDWTLSTTATYRWMLSDRLNAMLQGSLFHSDSAFSDFRNLPDEELPAYTTLGFRIGVENDAWGAYIFGKNITNERIPLDINPPTDSTASIFGTFVGRPREVGVEVRARFN